jgi:perosamine synthetase
VDGLAFNDPGSGVESSYWLTTIVWDESRELSAKLLRDALAPHGIDTRPLFSPLSSLGAFRTFPGAEGCRDRNPVSYRLQNRGINLPSSLRLQEEDVEFICERIRAIFC